MESGERLKESEGLLESILRGAAKILGCSSANMIAFNTKTREVRIQVGAINDRYPKLKEIEGVVGNSLQSMVFDLDNITDSMVYAAWHDRTIYETDSIAELVGSVFPDELKEQGPQIIGEYRFICVPVLCGQKVFGVIIFTKEDKLPFGVQQREILLRYAQRIGEIIEYDLSHRSALLPSERLEAGTESPLRYLLLDRTGSLRYWSAAPAVDQPEHAGGSSTRDRLPDDHGLPGPVLPELAGHATRMLRDGLTAAESFKLSAPSGGWLVDEKTCVSLRADLMPLKLDGEDYVLCALFGTGMRSRHFLHTQLLYFALNEAAPALLLDPDFRITSCNEAAEQLFGYQSLELLRRPIGMLFQDAHDIENILNHQFLFLAQGYYEDRVSLRHKSGRISMGRIEALLLADEANQMIGFMVLIHEAQWQEAGPGQKKVQELMSRERLATMGEMAAQLAHELRNPLVSIGATIEMLSREEGRDRESREILSTLSAEVAHMDTLLKDYLSLAARRSAPVTTVNISQVFDDARRLLRGAREAEGKEIVNLLTGDLEMLADYDGMRHVFLNLLRNALEATPSGRKVACHAAASEQEIKIYMDDEGTGLSHPASECFKSFFTTKKNGTGLGLTVCQKTIQAYGGTLSLGNLDLGGCRATIILPRKARR